MESSFYIRNYFFKLFSAAAAELVEAISQAAFAGRYAPERVGFFKKLLLWVLAKKPVDHVDPPTVRAWARELDFTRASETS